MKTQKTKEIPLYNATTKDIIKYYNFVYMFILDMKNRKIKTGKYRTAFAEPTWAAAEILYLALYGYTKKTKFAKSTQYIRWNNAPKKLETRVISLLGTSGKRYIEEQENEINTIKKEQGVSEDTALDVLSFEFRTDDVEVTRRMQKYIDDFDLHSSIDHDILKNLIKTQMMIETAQNRFLQGKSTSVNTKELTDQLKNYVILLGLSKKDRVDLGAERKKGSIAELASVYEETLQEYPELESEFLEEELSMLLDKYERRNTDGDRELSAKHFRIVSGGFTIEEAREITGRKRKNAKKGSTPNS